MSYKNYSVFCIRVKVFNRDSFPLAVHFTLLYRCVRPFFIQQPFYLPLPLKVHNAYIKTMAGQDLPNGRISLAKQSTKAENNSVAVTAAPAIAANILAAGILMLLLPVLAFRGKNSLTF